MGNFDLKKYLAEGKLLKEEEIRASIQPEEWENLGVDFEYDYEDKVYLYNNGPLLFFDKKTHLESESQYQDFGGLEELEEIVTEMGNILSEKGYNTDWREYNSFFIIKITKAPSDWNLGVRSNE